MQKAFLQRATRKLDRMVALKNEVIYDPIYLSYRLRPAWSFFDFVAKYF